jgi:tetratricopeptide (TPR) repeat protein
MLRLEVKSMAGKIKCGRFLLQLVLALGFLATSAVVSAQSVSDRSAIHSLAALDSLLENNLNGEAVEASRSHWETYRENPQWNRHFENRLSIALLRNGQPLEALPFLENLVVNSPLEAQGHRNLGSCLVALGRKGRALSEYQRAVELDPGNYIFHLEYGQLLQDMRIFENAGQEILMAVSLCGHCLEAQPVLADYYLAVGKPAEAVPALERIWQESGSSSARKKLLNALLQSGQDQLAVELLAGGPLEGLSREELHQLIAAEGRLSQWHHSLFFVEELSEGDPGPGVPACVGDDPVFWGLVSLNLMNAELDSEGLLAVNRAVALAPENVVFRNNRVVLLQRLGQDDKAALEWEKVLELDPSLAEAQGQGQTNR